MPLTLCILYLRLLGMEFVIKGVEQLFVYQGSAEDKSAPVAYRRSSMQSNVAGSWWTARKAHRADHNIIKA